MMFGREPMTFASRGHAAAGQWTPGQPTNGVMAQAPVKQQRRRHIHTERQRRIYMSSLLESLQSLLPDPRPRKDRCTLLSEVISYVRSLEDTMKDLEKRKEEIVATLQQRRLIVKISSNHRVSISREESNTSTILLPSLRSLHVQEMLDVDESTNLRIPSTRDIVITFLSSHIRGVLSEVLLLLDKHRIEVINVTFSTTPTSQKLHFIHARVPEELGFKCDDVKVLLVGLMEP